MLQPRSRFRILCSITIHVSRKGQHDQFIQGEGLDTMYDALWFAVAMVNSYRATGDPYYKEVLTRWQLPFYLKLLNHSDELSDTGGYAHLISAASQWLLYLDGKKDWQTHRIPAAEAELPAASASEQRR